MRIRSRVALVGGIPITIAAAIAVIAWLLLSAAERTRDGVVLAGTVYRDLLGLMVERDDYIRARASERSIHLSQFSELAAKGAANLDSLARLAREPSHRTVVTETREVLQTYSDRMWDLIRITIRNDRLIADMNARAASLVELSDRARERQHASNTDIVASLTASDRKLRLARDIVDRAQELRAALAAVAQKRQGEATDSPSEIVAPVVQHSFMMARVRNAAADLEQILRDDSRTASANELVDLLQRQMEDRSSGTDPVEDSRARLERQRFADWVERLIKVNSTEQRSLHDETAQLLTYSVNAAETEQVTQNIAIASLKLQRKTADALAARDADAAEQILQGSASISETVASLPISPLIQSEMTDAIAQWREGLATTAVGLRGQNSTIADMDAMAQRMVTAASTVNDMFTGDANRIGQVVRTILLLGAATGLLLGTGTAFIVARSITGPLKSLRDRMISLASNPAASFIPEATREDELGAMARAANLFVREITRREEALRQAKEQADETLQRLKETQADLIQAEKLASLGQLVAGVAHEINTPLGVALTTSTALQREATRLQESASAGKLTRSEFNGGLERLAEGSRLLLANLTRAIDLVYSFKQVAADQASGERRRFELKSWLEELLTSIGPVLRKTGHFVEVACPSGIELDSFPGSLGQVLTNLIMNSIVHAYAPEQAGHLSIAVSLPRRDMVRLVFGDDGRGIPPENLSRIFDPFFTTGRERGGTGLGLHIVYNLVTVGLQGSIDVESTAGQGTSFTIDLPLVAPERSGQAPVPHEIPVT
ncbi:sensor histidine kinase [Microvirga massiliensis]|uniref:sensor histidine kinase n=1 Tax=Microvirga massiliensis TaxID=1033741 RepID=UPI00062B3270|nr:HAMP domain-containing sensor histidine kinase [Microvirga massiliensis]